MKKMFHNNKESTILSAYRDTLLPKLMNGVIDVSNVNIKKCIAICDTMCYNSK